QRESQTQFIGSFGLITNQYVRKPAYWAFKSLATVGPQRIGVTTSNPFVVAIAGMANADEQTAVVAYHPPPMGAFARSVLEGLLGKGYTPSQLQQALGDISTVERLLRGDITVASLSLPSAFAADLGAQISALSPTAIAATQALGSRVNVTVRFADIDGRRFQQTMYRIDSANTNPLRIASKIDQTVQGRLASAKTTLDANLTSRLLSLGYSDAAISKLKWVLSQPDKDAAIATLSPGDRMSVLAMMQEVLKYMSELFTSISADINTWPEVAMNPATDGIASNVNGQAAVSFSMEPYSVVVVKARKY
ncbi:MAG TPA: hypothetical protein VNT02_08485, partial [Burkholderiales bacterium]|nr:hypothetical protein [Burkholderiales bacterium]